jgi:hypothetical protein
MVGSIETAFLRAAAATDAPIRRCVGRYCAGEVFVRRATLLSLIRDGLLEPHGDGWRITAAGRAAAVGR